MGRTVTPIMTQLNERKIERTLKNESIDWKSEDENYS